MTTCKERRLVPVHVHMDGLSSSELPTRSDIVTLYSSERVNLVCYLYQAIVCTVVEHKDVWKAMALTHTLLSSYTCRSNTEELNPTCFQRSELFSPHMRAPVVQHKMRAWHALSRSFESNCEKEFNFARMNRIHRERSIFALVYSSTPSASTCIHVQGIHHLLPTVCTTLSIGWQESPLWMHRKERAAVNKARTSTRK